MNILAILIFIILQVFIGGFVFVGLRKLILALRKKEKWFLDFQMYFLIFGVLGKSYFFVLNSIRFMDKFF